ncbi:MAG TPA: SMC family ATPase, partial [Gemmataceae bacterium]|nr:SMC family ATPase [Gemmataceae bacterium]
MIPKRIELENFLSFGKPAVEFTFTDDEPLWALCGRNGVGKSAVFDGITYALYGEHRGGTQKADQLIRHSANGFRIVFEFEFAGVEYRITRVRAGRTSQKVERRIDGEWEAVPGVNSAPDVKAWVEKTLGLGYKAFTTSVLLRQGEADKLFSASRDERIAVLKGIIGFERFEEVSGRVHAATLSRGNTHDTLRRQLNALLPVTPEERESAENAVTSAEQNRQEAQTALSNAVQRVVQAKQWEGLEKKRTSLEQQLAAAKKRAQDAATIRADKARLDDLAIAVPELQSLVGLSDKIAGLEPKITQAESTRAETATAIDAKVKAAGQARQKEDHHKQQAAELDRQAKTLGEEITRGANFLQLAEAMEKVKEKLAAYPADLADQVTQAEADERAADEGKRQADSDLAAAAALLKQSREQQERFADVKIGVICSQCGQMVDEVRAAKERARLANEIHARETRVDQLSSALATVEATRSAASKRRVLLQKRKTEFDTNTAQLATTSATLVQLGAIADAAELRACLARQKQEKGEAEARAAEEWTKQTEATEEAKRLEREKSGLDTRLQTAANTVRTLELQLATDRAAYNSGFARLTVDWQSRLPTLDADAVGTLATERNRLQQSGVAARFELLRQDAEKQAEWSKQLGEVQSEINAIPTDAQIPAKEAERRQGEAKTAADAANGTRDMAVQTRDGLKTRAAQYENVTTQVRAAERQHDVHKKLDTLLGQNGLQRELVRDAEQQIV